MGRIDLRMFVLGGALTLAACGGESAPASQETPAAQSAPASSGGGTTTAGAGARQPVWPE